MERGKESGGKRERDREKRERDMERESERGGGRREEEGVTEGEERQRKTEREEEKGGGREEEGERERRQSKQAPVFGHTITTIPSPLPSPYVYT